MESYFEIDVHGEYFAQVGEKKELRGYEASFKIPNADKPLSVVKGKLLIPFLQRQDPQCSAVYTHYVDEIRCKGRALRPDEIPVRFQTKDQLKEYIKFHQLGIDVDDYENIGRLREHVRMAKDEPEVFPDVQKKYLEKKEEENKLFQLNEDILVKTNKPVDPHVAKTSGEDKPQTSKKLGKKKVKQENIKTGVKKKSEDVGVEPVAEKSEPEDLLS